MPASETIRTATPADLSALYELARAALVHDTFSLALLAEKLFAAPRTPEFEWLTFVAEVGRQPVGFLQTVVRRPALGGGVGPPKAWVGLFAVDAAHRRRGVARRLLDRAAQTWPADTAEVEVLAIPGNYFTPGLDPRYTAALCFLERCGFERFRDCVNLVGQLDHTFDTAAEEARLAADGIVIRRARDDDGPRLDAFFAAHFGADWRFEAHLAHAQSPPALHLALRDDQIVAFAAHSGQNREWGFFGPMGTAPEARGLGLGRVLLWHCLNDLRAAGHRTALIPWVGPISFYHAWAGCRVARVFWRYRRTPGPTGARGLTAAQAPGSRPAARG